MASETPTPPDDLESSRMPLWEHLDELRTRLVRSLLVLAVAVIVTYTFSGDIVRFLERPLLGMLPPEEAHLYFTGITDKFFVYLQVSILSAAVLISPYLLFELWGFISPALYRNEKRFLFPFLLFGTVSFAAGLAFAYYLVLPYGYKFLIEFGSPEEKAIITLTSYFSLTLKMMLALGLVFELPVLLVLLAKFGIVEADTLVRHRRHAFVGAAVLSAVVTPSPDAFTMILVMVPLYFLYEVSIIGVRLVARPAEENDAKPDHVREGT